MNFSICQVNIKIHNLIFYCFLKKLHSCLLRWFWNKKRIYIIMPMSNFTNICTVNHLKWLDCEKFFLKCVNSSIIMCHHQFPRDAFSKPFALASLFNSFMTLAFKWSLYAPISPFHSVTVSFSHIQILSATYKNKTYCDMTFGQGCADPLEGTNQFQCNTWLMSRKSWETNTRPPSKLLIASASASIVSISKWLVGSSSNNIWGDCQANHANTTRQRCPSLSCFICDV